MEDQIQAGAGQAEVLEFQAAELRHRDQAVRVAISETHYLPSDRSLSASGTNTPIRHVAVRTYVKDTSDEPVYGAELRWVSVTTLGYRHESLPAPRVDRFVDRGAG